MQVPRVVLSDMGPHMDLSVRRTHFAAPNLAKLARKQAKQCVPPCCAQTGLAGAVLGLVAVGVTRTPVPPCCPCRVKPPTVKNVTKNAFGDKVGRVHMLRQDYGNLQTRKLRGLKVRTHAQLCCERGTSSRARAMGQGTWPPPHVSLTHVSPCCRCWCTIGTCRSGLRPRRKTTRLALGLVPGQTTKTWRHGHRRKSALAARPRCADHGTGACMHTTRARLTMRAVCWTGRDVAASMHMHTCNLQR